MAMVWLIVGYLCGSVSSAILICRIMGYADPRTVGSRNPGTTNVLRNFGKLAAALTLIGDVAKGVIPVLLAYALDAGPLAVAAAGFGAFLGHLYPVFFQFVGGKGVATLIGVLLSFHPWLGVIFMLSWIAVAVITRYSSLSALTATALAPVAGYFLKLPAPMIGAVLAMGVLVYWRHTGNIRNLMNGTEDKIGKKKSV